MAPARAQAAYYLATGVWPLLSRRSFEAVTGPKADFWLAQTVGVLAAVIGGTIGLAVRRRRVTPEVSFLGVASALGFAAVDVVSVAKGRISRVYLLDAAVEGAFVAGWARLCRPAREA